MRTIRPLIIDDASHASLFCRLRNQVVEESSELVPDSNCWVVKGADDGKGYKKMRHQGRWMYKHRVMYTLLKGEIPTGLVLDHRCRRHNCINPDHLEAVTVVVNTARGNGAWMLEQGKYPT